MKKIKQIFIGVLLITIIFTMTSCGKKTSITSENFKNIMEEKNYIIKDATSQMSNYDYIKQVYIAISNDYTFQIEFYEFSDNDYAISFFNNNKQIFEDSKSQNSVETSVSTDNNAKYTLTDNDKYKVISRIDNTIIYLNVNKDYKTSVKDILDELGY